MNSSIYVELSEDFPDIDFKEIEKTLEANNLTASNLEFSRRVLKESGGILLPISPGLFELRGFKANVRELSNGHIIINEDLGEGIYIGWGEEHLEKFKNYTEMLGIKSLNIKVIHNNFFLMDFNKNDNYEEVLNQLKSAKEEKEKALESRLNNTNNLYRKLLKDGYDGIRRVSLLKITEDGISDIGIVPGIKVETKMMHYIFDPDGSSFDGLEEEQIKQAKLDLATIRTQFTKRLNEFLNKDLEWFDVYEYPNVDNRGSDTEELFGMSLYAFDKEEDCIYQNCASPSPK